MDYKIHRFDEVDSTNSLLKKGNYPVGSVAVAKIQTKGRGRGGRSFSSPAGGLYMSCVLGFDSVDQALFVPITAAVAVRNVLSQYVECKIKWPNDIVTDGKKLCGILAESYLDKIILGIGVNVNIEPEYFKSNGLSYATSLYLQSGKNHSVEEIMTNILNNLNSKTDKVEILKEYKQHCITLGKKIRVIQGTREYDAEAVDLTENGELMVNRDGKLIVINSGIVSVRGSEYI
jgi:BirA family biotin operon repressor/biotin-[acetyl-CoA-carboxylase] ligase